MRKKFLKTYEAFMLDRKFKFEEKVINPILEYIRDNQLTLTQPENLPQLAKLGYMYNTLWYSGRICWGYDGLLLDAEVKKAIEDYDGDDDDENSPYQFISCEDNPKYKIEMCNPHNTYIEDLIYDAWSMHIAYEASDTHVDFNTFKNLILNGKELSDYEKKRLKVNKTFDDWVEILMHPEYKYKYESRKSVASQLLCTIGSGYEWGADGYIKERSAADTDKSIYGDWMNSKFTGELKSLIDDILAIPEVKETLDAARNKIVEAENLKKKEEKDRWKSILGDTIDSGNEAEIDSMIKKLLNSFKNKKIETDWDLPEDNYVKYYPISRSSPIYAVIDKETRDRLGIQEIHKSYIDASIEVCKDIMENETKEESSNVEFAKKLLTKLNIQDFSKDLPTEIDKYDLYEELKDILYSVTDNFYSTNSKTVKKGECSFYLNDTKNDQYADNNYYLVADLSSYKLPYGFYNNIDVLKGTDLYSDLSDALNRIREIDEVYDIITTYVDVEKGYHSRLNIIFYTNPKYFSNVKYVQDFENDLIKNGFQVGSSKISYRCGNIIFQCRKPIPLGKGHPSNKTGKDIFSNAHEVGIYDTSGNKIGLFTIDERGFNTKGNAKVNDDKIKNWIDSEFEKMKSSDVGYTNKSKNLYAHDFFIWLSNNPIK